MIPISTPFFTFLLVILFLIILAILAVVDVAQAVRRHGGHRLVRSLLPLLSPFLQPQ